MINEKPTMKQLRFLQACPDDTYYTWQVHLWLDSLREIGHSDKAVSLIFTHKSRELNPKWQQIVDLYPEAKFHFYKDDDNLNNFIGLYIPIIRPYVLWRYFKEFPETAGDAIFYCDSDILFMKDFNVDSFLEDDRVYLSDTNSYINAAYFDSKIKDVLPEKLEEYKSRDVLSELTSMIGINRQICEENNLHSGGAQYLLKNVDAAFWNKVLKDCIIIRTYLQKINREFFKDESAGFQSWCADMWAVLWNIWLKEQKTEVIPEMGFAWSTDPIGKLKTHPILHNAGIICNEMVLSQENTVHPDGTTTTRKEFYPAFFKGNYHTGKDPFTDPHLDTVLNSEKSKGFCNWYYVSKMKDLKEKYKLNY